MKLIFFLIAIGLFCSSNETSTKTETETTWRRPDGLWGYNNYWLNNKFAFFPYGLYGYSRAFYRPYGWGYLSSPLCAIGGYYNQLCMLSGYPFSMRNYYRPYYSCFRGLECAYRYGRCGWVGTPTFYSCWNGYSRLY